jgi:uncharacterized protein (TIGR02588 family)
VEQLRKNGDPLHNGDEPESGSPDTGSSQGDPTSEPSGANPQQDQGRSTAEKITTAICVLLIATLAGAILYEGYATGQSDPATVEVTVLEADIEARGDAFYVPVEIHNAGDQTVEEVAVSIEVLDGDEVVDEGETVVATLSEDEKIMAVLVLADDPAGLTIEAGVVTYQIAED